MKRIVFIGFIIMLTLSTSWGQTTGVMPKRSHSMNLPAKQLLEKRADTPVEVEEIISDTTVINETVANEFTQDVIEAMRPVDMLSFNEEAIDMLGFDKRMSETKESFLLRNNTSYHLSRVEIKLVYRAPDGQMINYRTQVVECDLMPFSTRRCEIPSFDTSKSYYHVDSPPARSSGRPFKVSFQLLRYDVVVKP